MESHTKIGVYTKVTINKGSCVSQDNMFMIDGKVVKGSKTTIFEINNRGRLYNFLLSLEQCKVVIHHYKSVVTKIMKILSDNNIDIIDYVERCPFNDKYLEVEFEFFN